jgi:hypothetical protein
MDPFKPEDWLRFVRFPAFTRDWERLGLSDADLRALEVAIWDRAAVWSQF